MIYYPQRIQEIKDYRDNPGLSQSFLKSVLSNNTKPFKETVQTIIGSYLDALLTTPGLSEEMFQVGLAKRPSGTIKEFIDKLWEEQEYLISDNLDVQGYRDRILELVRQQNYQPNWGDDAIWKSILKDGQDYWSELCSSQGKKLITSEEHNLCTTVAALVLSSPITGKYFIHQPNVEKYFQKDIYWISEGELCKGLIDELIIEHETKTIYIIDIKSTGIYSIEEWFMMARQKGYNFQLSFYKEGVIQTFKDLIDEGYTIKCRWMVIPTNVEKFKPWIIPCTDLMLEYGEYGYDKNNSTYTSNFNKSKYSPRKYYRGWRYAIQQYKRCKSESLSDYDLRWFDYQGKLPDIMSDELFFN